MFLVRLARDGLACSLDYKVAGVGDIKRGHPNSQAHLKWREENGIDTILQDFHFQV